MKKRHLLFAALIASLAFAFPSGLTAKGGGGGGSRSFSGGSRSSSFSSSRSFSSPSRSSGSGSSSLFGSSRTFSSLSRPSYSSTPYRDPGAVHPSNPGFKTSYDSGAAQAHHQQESKSIFQQNRSAGTTKPLSAPEQRVRQLSHELNYQRWENRELRKNQLYSSYYARPVTATYVYHDNFNPWFWMWLMDRPQHDRDYWVYNHRDEMDPARYAELKSKDVDLEKRLTELEKNGTTKDPIYTPPGIDSDLVYSNDHAKKIYDESNKSHFPWGILFGVLVLAALVYLIFFKRWQMAEA